MSGRMTKEDAARIVRLGRTGAWSRKTQNAALDDWMRARASEVEKDTTIKVLADALEGVVKRHDRDPRYSGLSWDDANAFRTALRLAGRLP